VKDRPPGNRSILVWGKGGTLSFSRNKVGKSPALTPESKVFGTPRRTAHQLKVHLNASVAREEDFDLGREKWDLIVVTLH